MIAYQQCDFMWRKVLIVCESYTLLIIFSDISLKRFHCSYFCEEHILTAHKTTGLWIPMWPIKTSNIFEVYKLIRIASPEVLLLMYYHRLNMVII